jgi:hypothetical protein
MSRSHKPRDDAYAVVRVELDSDLDWSDRITVKEVVSSEELAQREVQRLNQLNAGKGCLYFATHTRVFPLGQSAGSKL